MSLQQSIDTNNCCIIQVTNISPSCTSNQVETLFAILGRIEEMHLYPKEESSVVACRSCCIRYSTPEEARLATHLTNTVFIDKTLTIGHPRFETLASDKQISYSELMSPENHRHGSREDSPSYSSRSDPALQDEIRRTIYVGNLTHETTAEQVMKFFVGCGEIKFVRMAGDQSQMTRFAFIEFTDPNSIARAIQMNGAVFGDRVIKVNYSKKAIVKPNNSLSRLDPFAKENEALRRVKEASRFISEVVGSGEAYRSSRSRSREKKRHNYHPRSPRSPRHHSSSRYSRKASVEFRPDYLKRSKSPGERRSRSKSPRRSSSRERSKERGGRKSHRSSQSPRSERRNGGHHSREEKKHSSKHSHSQRREGRSDHAESRAKKGKEVTRSLSGKHPRQSPSDSPHKHKSKSKHAKKHKHRHEEPGKKKSRRHESASELDC